MNGTFRLINGNLYRVVMGTKEECIKSLSKFANFAFETYNAETNKVEYLYEATEFKYEMFMEMNDEDYLYADCLANA